MIRIALADDHKMFAKGIAGLLEEEDDLRVDGIFSNGKDLLDFLKTHQVDVILTDMNMPVLDGAGVLEAIKETSPKTKAIVLSMYHDEAIYNRCMKLGADAYVLKNSDPDELIYTVREVFEGNYLPSYSKLQQQTESDEYTDYYKLKFQLSKRETQILRMIKNGMTNKEIAASLNLSLFTVEAHRKKIHSKLKVSSVSELIRKAIDIGI
ncbi:response regulator [Mariniradius sediminis]|uniref:Response regulator transcription factor n=1 Tax=Mariniradius sediminis TaxID=2909237 RepID=A0ABS9BRK0_9BACT|nr:response regulator transcription factor [Mariniradius sediminis]MCF1749781.1 response regulator transcription factor [Mariniradius sediminis]